MIIFWRGWGIWVFILFCFWMIAGILIAVFSGHYEPDPDKAALEVQWGLAAIMLAYALSVHALARYRKTHPFMSEDPETGRIISVPHVDDLYGIRLDIWPHILGGYRRHSSYAYCIRLYNVLTTDSFFRAWRAYGRATRKNPRP